MKILSNIINTDPVSSDYPKGRIRNKNLGTGLPGTPIVEEVYGDLIQFFQKLVIEADLTENDLPDNVTNGYQLMDAFAAFIRNPYSVQWDKIAFIAYGQNIDITGSDKIICGMGGSDIAYLDHTNKQLRTYRFNGYTWTQIGSSFSITLSIDYYLLCYLAPNTIVLYNRGAGHLRVLYFNGSVWAQLGSTYLYASGNGGICYLAPNIIAFADYNILQLNVFTWNGSVFTLTGTPFTLTGSSFRVAYLADNLIALFSDETNFYVRMYSWNGSVWTQVGNPLDLGVLSGIPTILGHNARDITLFLNTDGFYRSYRFDGTNWSEYGVRYFKNTAVGCSSNLVELDNGIILCVDSEIDTFKCAIRVPILQ